MKKLQLIFAILIFSLWGSSNAAILTMDLDHEFSGAVAPFGTGPWLTATFDDGGTPGTVKLTLDAHLSPGEFISNFYFNLDHNVIGSFTYVSPIPAQVAALNIGIDAFKADGDGFYDMKIDFQNTGSFLFDGSDSIDVFMNGTGLIANSFNFLSAPSSGGHGPFLAAAQVWGTGPNNHQDSSWIAPRTVPSPATMLLLGAGLLGLGVIRRK